MTNTIKELVMKTEAIYYCGQGVIYRCPECHKVDRAPYSTVPKSHECRFCEKEIEFEAKSDMTPNLYKVIGEINRLETGTVFGASMEDLKKDNLVKAGKAVGIDVLADYGPSDRDITKSDLDTYFAGQRYSGEQLKKLCEKPDNREILEIMAPLLVGEPTAEEILSKNQGVHKEIMEEGKMRLLMKRNQSLATNESKMKLLKDNGFDPYIDRGKVCVFFGSSVAPEMDQWVCW